MRKQVLYVAALGILAWMTVPSCGEEGASCVSVTTQSQLRRLVITRMKADQMLNDMADLNQADLALSRIEAVHNADGSVSCKAVATLHVMYGAGLRRTIDNNVRYDLLKRGDDSFLTVKLQRFTMVF